MPFWLVLIITIGVSTAIASALSHIVVLPLANRISRCQAVSVAREQLHADTELVALGICVFLQGLLLGAAGFGLGVAAGRVLVGFPEPWWGGWGAVGTVTFFLGSFGGVLLHQAISSGS